MIIKYYIIKHLGAERMYVADKTQRMWLMKLTKHNTITNVDFQALRELGAQLIEVDSVTGENI